MEKRNFSSFYATWKNRKYRCAHQNLLLAALEVWFLYPQVPMGIIPCGLFGLIGKIIQVKSCAHADLEPTGAYLGSTCGLIYRCTECGSEIHTPDEVKNKN